MSAGGRSECDEERNSRASLAAIAEIHRIAWPESSRRESPSRISAGLYRRTGTRPISRILDAWQKACGRKGTCSTFGNRIWHSGGRSRKPRNFSNRETAYRPDSSKSQSWPFGPCFLEIEQNQALSICEATSAVYSQKYSISRDLVLNTGLSTLRFSSAWKRLCSKC
jgi:hypothetical protein